MIFDASHRHALLHDRGLLAGLDELLVLLDSHIGCDGIA